MHGLFPSLQCITRSSHTWLVPFFAVHYRKQSHMACSLLCSALQEAVTHGLFPSLQCITRSRQCIARSSHTWLVPCFAMHYRKQSPMACSLLCNALQEAVTRGLFPALQCIIGSSHTWLVPCFAVHYRKQSHMACSLLCSALQEAVTHGLFPSLQCIIRSSHTWLVPCFAVHYKN